MVDPLSSKAGAIADRRVAPVAPASAVAAAAPTTTATPTVQSTAAALTSSMAATPPVDSERVARVRKAVEDGRFPICPATIADRLLALKLQWNPNDPS